MMMRVMITFESLLLMFYCFVQLHGMKGKENLDFIVKLKRQLKPQTTVFNNIWNAKIWLHIGMLLQSRENLLHSGGGNRKLEALEAFDNAIRLNNGSSVEIDLKTYFYRGILLKTLGRGQESLDSFDAALAYSLNNFDTSSVMYNRAETLFMMGSLQMALSHYRLSLDLMPCRLERYYALVQCYKESKLLSLKDWSLIVEEIQTAINNCSQHGQFNRKALQGSHIFPGDSISSADIRYTLNDVDFLDSYLRHDYSNEFSISSATYWALFLSAEEASLLSVAWKSLEEAHKMEKAARESKFDRNQLDVQYQNLEVIFHKEFWTDLITPTLRRKSSRVPVFIVGMMRSGSTLLETMLDAHSQIWGLGEDSIFNGNISTLRDKLVLAGEKGQKAVEKVVLDYGRDTVKRMKRLSEEKAGKSKIKYITDKMLFNYRNIGFIHLVYPNAIILHMVRDPMDTLFSCFKNKFDDVGLEWTLDWKDLVAQYTNYLKIVAHFRRVLPGRVVDLRYEELVSDAESVLRRVVVDLLELPWEEQLLQFHKSGRAVQTNSMSQVRQSIYSSSIGAWRKYAEQLQPLRNELTVQIQSILEGKNSRFILPFQNATNWELREDFNY